MDNLTEQGRTERTKTGIWESVKVDVKLNAGSVCVGSTSNIATDGCGVAVREDGLVDYVLRVILSDDGISILASDSVNDRLQNDCLDVDNGKASESSDKSFGKHC